MLTLFTLAKSLIDGAPLWQQGPRLLVLAVWGTLGFLAALRLFRWS